MLETLHTPIWLALSIGGSIFAAIAYLGLRLGVRKESPRSSPGPVCSNQRFLKRFCIDDQARIYLSENGQRRLLHGRICDISDDGAKMISPLPLDATQTLYIELPELQLAGTAKVRTCAKQESVYHIGLQFTGPLFRWFAADQTGAISYTAHTDR